MSLHFRTPLFPSAARFFREVTQENEVTQNYPRGGRLLSGGCGNGCLIHKGTPTRAALPSGVLSAPNGARMEWELRSLAGMCLHCHAGVHDEAASPFEESSQPCSFSTLTFSPLLTHQPSLFQTKENSLSTR